MQRSQKHFLVQILLKMELIRNKQTIGLIIALCVLTIVALTVIRTKKNESIFLTCESARSELRDISFRTIPDAVSANAYYVRDSHDREYIQKNSTEPKPLASLTKIMTVRTVLKKDISLEQVYTLTKRDTAPYGSIAGIEEGQQFRIKDLLLAALVSSSNDAAEALMYSTGVVNEGDFFSEMNALAKQMGLSSMQFATATGLDTSGSATANGSAKDVAILLEDSVKKYPEVFIFPQETLYIQSQSQASVELSPTNSAIPQLPLLVASKTGYTLSAGGNLAVTWKHPYDETTLVTAVVLGSTFASRFTDITKLYSTVNTYLTYERSLPAVCKYM